MMAHVVDVLAEVHAGASCGPGTAARCCCWARCWSAASRWPRCRRCSSTRRVFGNFPMRLRWNFHRLMLEQSMGFYQDEFAGRIATKVMQTALAVRDTWLIVADILVYVVIYFVTLVGGRRRLRPLAGGCPSSAGWRCTSLTLWYFVPRLGRVGAGCRPTRAR
ncbi:MAG: hypothetical protein MZW92_22475 [Comamonadaceae bacterium]|nr:hypothetical protein [Comamonadaceae bacterium]